MVKRQQRKSSTLTAPPPGVQPPEQPKQLAELMPDGTPCPPGGRWCPVLGRIVPIPPEALSGDETKRRQAVAQDRSIDFRIMTEPGPRWEPQPSVGGESWRGHTRRFE
jgi:hypothetical protein